MFKEKNSPHKMPHVHAVFSGDKMSISAEGEILAGKLPRKQQKLVEAWVALREDEIKAVWIALNEMYIPFPKHHTSTKTAPGVHGNSSTLPAIELHFNRPC